MSMQEPPKRGTDEWFVWDTQRMAAERAARGLPTIETWAEECARRAGDVDPATMATFNKKRSGPPGSRQLLLTPASSITIKPVRWLWQDRLPAGSLVVPAGREGTGKSQFLIWLAAQITRGTLPGCHYGEPRAVFYCAAEDSWSHTITPRLVAAGADLTRVFKVAMRVDEDDDLILSLPADLAEVEAGLLEQKAVGLLLDPLMSYLHTSLDTHKNRDMRVVLDPLAKIADRVGVLVAGLAHFNKGTGSDGSLAISGASAFKDVPRSVLVFAKDSESGDRVMSETKNNLGRDDLPSLSYTIEPVDVPLDDGEFAHVSKLVWTGESDRSVSDLMRDANSSPEERSALDDAQQWLAQFLAHGPVKSDDVYTAARAAGHSEKTVKRAKKKLHVLSDHVVEDDGTAFWQFVPPAKKAKEAKSSTRDPVGPLGPLACQRCRREAKRLVTHNGTGERICPSCCEDEYGDA